jgi:hypothetical protein
VIQQEKKVVKGFLAKIRRDVAFQYYCPAQLSVCFGWTRRDVSEDEEI